MAAIEAYISSTNTDAALATALLVVLKACSNDFKGGNMNVLKAALGTCTAVASHPGPTRLPPAVSAAFLKAFVEKLGDKKLHLSTTQLLAALTETQSAGPALVVRRCCAQMSSLKSPATAQAVLVFLKETLERKGAAVLPLAPLCTAALTQVEAKNAGVRAAAVGLLGAAHLQLGAGRMQPLLTGATKAALVLLEPEFARVGFDPSLLAKMTKASSSSSAETKAGAGEGVVGSAADTGAFGETRIDLQKRLDKTVLDDMGLVEGKTSWQTRKVRAIKYEMQHKHAPANQTKHQTYWQAKIHGQDNIHLYT